MHRLRSNMLIIWLATVSLVIIGIIIYTMNAPVAEVWIYLLPEYRQSGSTEVFAGLSL